MKALFKLPAKFGVLSGTSFTGGDYAVDYAIGGVPFMAAHTADIPYSRETAPYRKDQFDAANEPGEQSIGDGWWRRGQDSFHGGRGLTYFESRDVPEEIARVRFQDSKNVDVWTKGIIQRLPDTTLGVANAGAITGLVSASSGEIGRAHV